MSLITWRKGESREISTHFKTDEFTCQCKFEDCIDQAISQDLLDRLERVRNEIQIPLKINSGFRCAKHQQELRESGTQTAAGKSQHELGEAADITAQMPIDDMVHIAGRYFLAIGQAKTWAHVDTRGGKKRYWTYA